jgi:hypothetical protein
LKSEAITSKGNVKISLHTTGQFLVAQKAVSRIFKQSVYEGGKAVSTSHLHLKKVFLVLISVRG